MKYHSMKALALMLGIFVFGAFYPINDNKDKEGMILHAVLEYLDALHFQPKPIDDQLSKEVYAGYIEDLDPAKRFLTTADLDQLAIYELQIDDQINKRTFEFFDQSVALIDEAYDRAEDVFDELIEYDFDFTIDEEIELDYEKRVHANDETQLKDYWRKYLKYELLSKAHDKLEAQEKDESEDKVIKSFDQLVEESREDLKENYEKWFERLDKVRRSDRFESYINAITHFFDPHSDYLNPKEKQDFDIRMGGKLEGIGARLSTDGEFTKVVSIVPGGPAWKGKDLQVDDIITLVTQEDGEQTDLKGMRIDDVVQKIRGKKGTIVTLSVKKPDGTLAEVVIERDEVILDEGFARSLILNEDGQDKIGYIRLPKFYSSFEGKNGNSCAEDVKKELIKLKDENVDGVILDLRNNGGGSLRDVITMSGLFIEKGPIVQVKPREDKARIYKDSDSDVVYDGPLIVMVNNYSASASEILAAALQDYNRAVVVGSPSTFGKGTVQRFFNLDEAFKKSQLNAEKLGNVKVTMQKFYRINGGSTQLKGVTPDIILPDSYHYIDLGEKDYDYALDWSVIEPLEYEQDVYRVPQLDNLIARSHQRLTAHPEFQMILENAKRLKNNRDKTSYSLNYDEYNAYDKSREAENEKYKDLMEKDLNSFTISNLDVDMPSINMDESKVARNEDWIDGLKKDIYVEEVLNIMRDMKGISLVERDRRP